MSLLSFKLAYYRGTGELYIGGIKAHKYNDNRCLADIGTEETEPDLYNCKEAVQKGMGIYWDFTQVPHNEVFLTHVFLKSGYVEHSYGLLFLRRG